MQRANDCDMVVLHDNDLERIDGIGKGTVSGYLIFSLLFLCYQSPEHLESEVMKDLIRMSNIEIYTACCGERFTSTGSGFFLVLTITSTQDDLSPSSSCPNTETGVVRVAMLSESSENWGRYTLKMDPPN